MGQTESLANKKMRVRPDGPEKVTGKMKYLTDLKFPNMLYGKILRSTYPHAEIISIRTEKAKQIPGVRSVITYHDVPGINGYGLIFPDQPVLCEDRVRCVGDAIAAIAADTEEIAIKALSEIEVEYRPLQVIEQPEKALMPDSIKLHPNGNLLHEASYTNGDVEKGFRNSAVIVEETYQLPRQIHAYMETEGGVIVPEEDGTLSVYVGSQHGFKDRFQLARILDLEESSIRVISSPIGGSFGGKDELNIQPYAALLALITGCPVKIHQTREESVKASIKRHPMKITMKTGVDQKGMLLAHQVKIVADTGAYASLGPAVLDFAIEHAAGPYLFPNIETVGLSVFTNNGVAGEFRGFGGNQVTFALEGQIDRLADQLGMDPIKLREINLRGVEDKGPVGQRIAPTNGAAEVLASFNQLNSTKRYKSINDPWKVRGTGIALTMHGGGLGVGRIDPAGGRLSFTKEGKIEAAFGFEECGQGLLSVIETLLLEEFQCGKEELKITVGDTALVPVSGSSTASRATSMVWQALQNMKEPFKNQVLEFASLITGVQVCNLKLGACGIWINGEGEREGPIITYTELGKSIPAEKMISVHTSFDFPTSPDPIIGSHYLYSFAAVRAAVEVDLLSGRVKVLSLDQAVAAGPVISPLGFLGQIEGGGIMALGYTLMEESKMNNSIYVTDNFDSYFLPTILDAPSHMDITAIEQLVKGDMHGPRGVGEIGTVAVAPAIARAIFDATGCWVNQLPVSPEYLLKNIQQGVMQPWM
ncbi:xanthine dehydrogenase subunit D [Bacillus sp. AK128]